MAMPWRPASRVMALSHNIASQGKRYRADAASAWARFGSRLTPLQRGRLTDEQRRRFDAMGARTNPHAARGTTEARRLMALCNQRAASFT
jgi:hypothetical protein